MIPHIQIKRVYEKSSSQDGYRILVDRLWPRGIKKDTLKYDLWAKDVTPSSALRQWFHEDPEGRWQEFCKRYQLELNHSQEAKVFVHAIKTHKIITLLIAGKDTVHTHAKILQAYIQKQFHHDS